MARIAGLSRSRTVLARLAFFLSRRSYGRVLTPAWRIYALDSGLLLAACVMIKRKSVRRLTPSWRTISEGRDKL